MIAIDDNGGQVVVGVAGQQAGLDQCARCDDAHNLAREDTLGGHLANLFGNGDAIAFFDQPHQVIVNGVVGDARQRDAHPVPDRARGQNDVQLAGYGFGVLVESLVKVPETEEENAILMLSFQVKVLLADWSDIFAAHAGDFNAKRLKIVTFVSSKSGTLRYNKVTIFLEGG